jgi:hypothetical protein
MKLSSISSADYKAKGYPNKKVALQLLSDNFVSGKDVNSADQVPSMNTLAKQYTRPLTQKDFKVLSSDQYKALGYTSKKEAITMLLQRQKDPKREPLIGIGQLTKKSPSQVLHKEYIKMVPKVLKETKSIRLTDHHKAKYGAFGLTEHTMKIKNKFDITVGIKSLLEIYHYSRDTLANIIQEAIDAVVSQNGLSATDRIMLKFDFDSDASVNNFRTAWYSVRFFNAEKVLFHIASIIQSNEKVLMTKNIKLRFSCIKLDALRESSNWNPVHVTGGNRAYHITTDMASRKTSITQVTNKDELCASRCIVIDRFRHLYLEKSITKQNWDRIRADPTLEANQLHEMTGIPKKRCGIPELSIWADIYGVQICIVNSHCFNRIGECTQDRKKSNLDRDYIYLFYRDGHFDLITSMKGFVCRDKYCHLCKKGYSTKTHRCLDEPATVLICECCGRRVKDIRAHLVQTLDAQGNATVSYQCEQGFCKNCCLQVADIYNHQCYIQKQPIKYDHKQKIYSHDLDISN